MKFHPNKQGEGFLSPHYHRNLHVPVRLFQISYLIFPMIALQSEGHYYSVLQVIEMRPSNLPLLAIARQKKIGRSPGPLTHVGSLPHDISVVCPAKTLEGNFQVGKSTNQLRNSQRPLKCAPSISNVP